MIGSIYLFEESQQNIITITFSALIVCEILNVFSEVYKVNYKMILSSILTFLVYFASIGLLRSTFNTSYITWEFVIRVFAVVVASWAPLHLFRCLYDYFDPSEHQKS